ncbi:hypothetical protein Cni_G09248 [Canna indica]|uniref:Retrotransposon gag domain-containing protein n=1 Tax=Canna indica TaxID=4628 RepID=A0AAQ3K1Z6_9LILI|nr:hypothetical protein Cni_G09248 [Canna indica]
MMLFNEATDLILCRAFPTSLEKAALCWISPLPLRSIDTFEVLSCAFTNLFSSSRIYSKTEDALHYIKQGQHRPLRDYIKRFQATTMEIPNLDLHIEIFFIKHYLKPGHFAY